MIPEGVPVVTLRKKTFKKFLKAYDKTRGEGMERRLLYGEHSRRIFMVRSEWSSNRNGGKWWYFTGDDVKTFVPHNDRLLLGTTGWDSYDMDLSCLKEDDGMPCDRDHGDAIIYEIVIVENDKEDIVPKDLAM